MIDWTQTNDFIGGPLMTTDVDWVTERLMQRAFGPGEPPYEENKGYGQKWGFVHPGVKGGFTVYFRWGMPRVGGTAHDALLEDFKTWLRAALENV